MSWDIRFRNDVAASVRVEDVLERVLVDATTSLAVWE